MQGQWCDAAGGERSGAGRRQQRHCFRTGGGRVGAFALEQIEGAALQEKTKKAQEGWAKKERDLQSKAAQLQEKYQKGLITTANAQSEQEKIQRQIANYQSVAQKEAQTLDEENYVFTNRAQDLIHRAVQELNADKKYKLILNATSLVDADSLLDITPLGLAKVNELYAADKKADKE